MNFNKSLICGAMTALSVFLGKVMPLTFGKLINHILVEVKFATRVPYIKQSGGQTQVKSRALHNGAPGLYNLIQRPVIAVLNHLQSHPLDRL